MLTSKKCVYVGGLPDNVDSTTLRNIFAAFGDITDLQMPLEVLTGKHKGYAFIEFKDNEDADDAIDNMHESEIYGKTIRVTPAKGRTSEGEMISSSRAVWESDEWLKQFAGKTLIGNDTTDDATDNATVQQSDYPTQKETIFMDVSIDGQYTGRMVFELRNDVVPKTAFNFRRLCEQTRGNGYKQCTFHRIIPGFMAQSGDFTNHNGTGGKSVFGEKFNDENFLLKHTNVGDLSMANSGPNTNGSQFFITFKKTDWLDDKHVVFGHLKSGVETLKKIEAVGTQKGKPLKRVIIEDCGQLL